ncbi:MAG: hypothetical protein ACK557_23970, partial [Planctomycetota bacterium]
MNRNSRLFQLIFLAAVGLVLGTLAQFVFGPPTSRSTEPPRALSVPRESAPSAGPAPATAAGAEQSK